MIEVTRPFLPDIEEYTRYVQSIWDRCWLTNNGPLVNDLELKLKEYLKADHMLYLGNGTVAIQIAIQALDLKGEVITTPFSFVATTSCLAWEKCKPVFVDIDPKTLCIDPTKIEERITSQTTAILATHVYGNPCDIAAIQQIADKHGLKVIYDAAHAFGTKYKGQSVFQYGDVSTTSFHATKLFHTIEGGAVFTQDANLLKLMSRMRNFGHVSTDEFERVPGINGKNSEFHAAMGLVNLKHINDIMAARKWQALFYDKCIDSFPIKVARPEITAGAEWNYSYYPVVFSSEEMLLKSVSMLNDHKVFPRRYFYPSLSSLHYVDKYEVPVAEDISRRVACLPMYHKLQEEDIEFICRILARAQNN